MFKSISRALSAPVDSVGGQQCRKVVPKFLCTRPQKSNFSVRHTNYRVKDYSNNSNSLLLAKALSTTSCSLERSNYSPSFYFDMNSQHLGQGSQCPPLQEGKLRIYSMRFCPFAQRAILVALAKGIPHDVVNCQLKEKPEWLLEKNYNGKVPVIEFSDGRILYESLVVSEFFDKTYKNRPLSAGNPFEKGVDRIWIEEFNKIISSFYKILFAVHAEDKEVLKTRLIDLLSAIARFEKELCRRGTTFFGGDCLPGMVDYMIWPWVERMPAFTSFIPNDFFNVEEVKKQNPKLESWRNVMKEDFAVKEFFLPPNVHKEFIQGFLNKNLNYDILEAKAKL